MHLIFLYIVRDVMQQADFNCFQVFRLEVSVAVAGKWASFANANAVNVEIAYDKIK